MRISDWSSDVCSSDLIAIVQQNAAIPSDYPALNIAFAPANGRAADWSPGIRPFANNKFRQASLRSDWEVVDDITLTSLTSYVDYDHHQGIEGDGTGSVAKIVKLEHAWRRLDGRNDDGFQVAPFRSEEHTSELQSLMRISYAVFCLKKKNTNIKTILRLPRNDTTQNNTSSKT